MLIFTAIIARKLQLKYMPLRFQSITCQPVHSNQISSPILLPIKLLFKVPFLWENTEIYLPAENPETILATNGVFSLGSILPRNLKITPSFAIAYMIRGIGNIPAYKL